MRDENRIPQILARLQKVWEGNPNLRLGQLIEDVFLNTAYDFISGYFLEDEEFIKTVEDFYSELHVFRRFGKKRRDEQIMSILDQLDSRVKFLWFDVKHKYRIFMNEESFTKLTEELNEQKRDLGKIELKGDIIYTFFGIPITIDNTLLGKIIIWREILNNEKSI